MDLELNKKQMEPVSPFREDFLSYIDPHLRSATQILISKGYLTAYSCEGHTVWRYRHIDLVFENSVLRENFLKLTKKFFSRFFLKFEKYETSAVELIKGETYTWQDRKEEIRGLNFIFRKNSESFCFLRVYIGAKALQYDIYRRYSLKEEILITLSEFRAALYNLFLREIATRIFEYDLKFKCTQNQLIQ
jgi:hypothetical protein